MNKEDNTHKVSARDGATDSPDAVRAATLYGAEGTMCEAEDAAVSIADSTDCEEDGEEVGESACMGNIDDLLSAELTQRALEECPPDMMCNYLEALVNSDPRAGFEMLHLGALHAIENAESIPHMSCEATSYVVPCTVIQQSDEDGGESRFYIPTVHSLIERRSPMEREEAALDEVISARTRRALADALGANILEHLHLYSDSLA